MASSVCMTVKATLFSLKMPDFSKAMSVSVGPRTFV